MSPDATPTADKAPAPSSMSEAVQMFKDDQAKAAAAKTAETDAAAKVEEKKPEAPVPAAEGKTDGAAAPEKAGPKHRFVNEKGEDAPFSFKADGKDMAETDPEKVKKYVELGYHASQRLEELNAREKVLNEKAAIIELVDQAMKDGRLVINEKAAEKKAEEKPEPEGYVDPEVKELREKRAILEKQQKETSALFIKSKIEEEVQVMKTAIADHKKEFPNARDKDVIDLLGLTDKETGKPLYDYKTAVEASHKEMTEFLEGRPLSAKQREAAIADYIASKAKSESAPVGAPSGSAPGAPGGAKAPEAKKIASMADAIEQWKRDTAAEGKPPQF